MADPTSILLLIGLGTLIVERIYSAVVKAAPHIKKSSCCGSSIEMRDEAAK